MAIADVSCFFFFFITCPIWDFSNAVLLLNALSATLVIVQTDEMDEGNARLFTSSESEPPPPAPKEIYRNDETFALCESGDEMCAGATLAWRVGWKKIKERKSES